MTLNVLSPVSRSCHCKVNIERLGNWNLKLNMRKICVCVYNVSCKFTIDVSYKKDNHFTTAWIISKQHQLTISSLMKQRTVSSISLDICLLSAAEAVVEVMIRRQVTQVNGAGLRCGRPANVGDWRCSGWMCGGFKGTELHVKLGRRRRRALI